MNTGFVTANGKRIESRLPCSLEEFLLEQKLLPRSVVAAASREGRVAVHELPLAEARVDTMFVRRRDAYVSSALSAFLERARRISADLPERRADAAE